MQTDNKTLVAESRLISEGTFAEKFIRVITTWEAILAIILVAEFVYFSNVNAYFLDSFNLLNASFSFSEKAILALSMIFVIICGDIDISVASIVALASVVTGYAAANGAESWMLILIAMSTGLLAGAFNGVLITLVGIPAIAITLGTQSVFRGICYIILKDKAYTEFPEDFSYYGQEYIFDSDVPFELCLFILLAVVIGFILHFTAYGRKLYAIGNCTSTAVFSGIKVQKIRFINFALNGLFSGIVAVLLTSRIGSARPNMALGWELEAITLVILGGVSISGGKGNIIGVFIATLLLGYLKYGMGIMSISGKVMIITTGFLLVAAVFLPGLLDKIKEAKKLRKQRAELSRNQG